MSDLPRFASPLLRHVDTCTPKIRTHSATKRDGDLKHFGAPSPLDCFEFSPVDFFLFLQGLKEIAPKCRENSSLSFFSLVFCKIPRKTSKTPRILLILRTLKTLEIKQKTLKKTKEFRSKKNTKETKIPRKRRTGLVSNCSATPTRIAATPPGARQGFGGPTYPRHPTGGSGIGCDRALGGGCSCDTPATPSKLRKEPRRGCSYTLERDRGGCSVCAT